MPARRMIWFSATWLVVSCLGAAGFGDERPTLADLAEFLEAATRLAEARKEEQRLLLIDRAMAFSQDEKLRAGSERQKLEQKIDRLNYLNGLRNWALDTFEAESRQQLPKTEGLSKRVERLQRVDAQFKHIYLSLPEQSRGAVRSGRALNFFLNICGNAAESQEIYREQIRDEIARLKLEVTKAEMEIAKAETEPDEANQRVELERIQLLLNEAVLKQKLLDQLSAKAVLTPEHLRKISYERGTIGGQIVISPRDGALPLSWPTYFVRNDNEYGAYRSLIEAAKATALEELKAGTGITVETQTTLMTATDGLTAKFNRDQQRNFRTGQVGSWERIESRNFITTLRAGVLRFVKARELSDVQPSVPFEGSRIDELLAYMSRQGLRFHEADTNGEYVYDLLYRQMVDYYLALHSVQRSIESDEQAIETLTSKENKLFEQEHRSTVDDLIAALQAKQPRDFAEQIRDIGAGVRDFGTGWNEMFGTRDRHNH